MRKLSFFLSILLLLSMTACGLTTPKAETSEVSKVSTEETSEVSSSTPKDEEVDVQPQPLYNNRYYESVEDFDYNVYDIYIKVFPTYNEEGKLLTRKAFDKHKALDKTYNPVLNCHVWEDDPAKTEGNELKVGYTSDEDDVNGTIRVRGNSSRGAAAKNFKVKLSDQGARIFGMDSINLNKHMQDYSRAINKACMDMMQMFMRDYVSLETRFVHLYINDVDEDGNETGFVSQGLYTFVEQPNVDFLINHGLDENGSIYKPISFEFREHADEIRTEDDPLYDEATFSKIVKPMVNPDHQKLRNMLDAVNDYSLDFMEVFDQYFDEDNYLTWMALNIALGNLDTLVHNFLLYSPNNSEKWYMLPWDFDGSLEYYDVKDWGARSYTTFGINYYWSIPMHQRYFRVEGNVEKLTAKILEIMDKYFTEETVKYIENKSLEVVLPFMAMPEEINLTLENWKKSGHYLYDRIEGQDKTQFLSDLVVENTTVWYDTMKNNVERYLLTLDHPTAGHIWLPQKQDDGKWVFSWDTSHSFQKEIITYEFQLATDQHFENIVYDIKDLKATRVEVESLPEGFNFYRFIARDESGHEQYPLNRIVLENEDGSTLLRGYGYGFYDNGGNVREKYETFAIVDENDDDDDVIAE